MNKYEKGKNDSYCHNSLVIIRDGDPAPALIHSDLDGVFARLNGYAIIPMEKYCELTDGAYDDQYIKQADLELWNDKEE